MSKTFKNNFRLLRYTAFFQNVVAWYPIFIPFAYSINLSTFVVAVSIVVVNVAILIFEIPSGILADRFSRKNVIALSGALLAISSAIYGISNSALMYIIASFVWGISYAAESGTYEAITYDLLAREKKTSEYRRYVSTIHLTKSYALIIGAISGGIFASAISYEFAFFITLIPLAISIIPLIKLNEPALHAQDLTFSYSGQFKKVLSYLSDHPKQISITTLLVLISASIGFLFELNQAYYFAVGVPIALYGLLQASLQMSIGLGSWVASLRQAKALVWSSIALLPILIGLIFVLDSVIGAILLSVVMTLLFAIYGYYGHFIQEKIPSDIRASTTSVIGTGGRIIFSGMALAYGLINSSEQEITGFVVFAVAVLLAAVLSWKTFGFVSEKVDSLE